MIYCIAEFEAKKDRERELFRNLQSLEEETHKEKGCIQYKVTRKMDNEFAKGISKGIVFNEIWETEEDFNNHNKAEHIQKFFSENCLDEKGSVKSWNVNLYK